MLFKTEEDLKIIMEQNKPVNIVNQSWVEVQKNKKLEDFVNKLKSNDDEESSEYYKLYPITKVVNIKIGNLIIEKKVVPIEYIEYNKEEQVPVLDANGNPVLDPETNKIKTQFIPVFPDKYYELDENGNKVLKKEYKDLPVKPTFDYWLQKKVEEFISNPVNLEVDMNEFVEFVKPYLVKLVNVEFTKAMNTITGQYPEHEQQTWDQQSAEAKAYLADPTKAVVPLISGIAKNRGVDLKTLATKILAKSEAYKAAAGQAIGYRQRAIVIINSIPDYPTYQKVVAEFEAERDAFYKAVEGK